MKQNILIKAFALLIGTLLFSGTVLADENTAQLDSQKQIVDNAVENYIHKGTLISGNEIDKIRKNISELQSSQESKEYTSPNASLAGFMSIIAAFLIVTFVIKLRERSRAANNRTTLALALVPAALVLLGGYFFMGWQSKTKYEAMANDLLNQMEVVKNADRFSIDPVTDILSHGKIKQSHKCWESLQHRPDMSAVKFEIDHACERLSVVRSSSDFKESGK